MCACVYGNYAFMQMQKWRKKIFADCCARLINKYFKRANKLCHELNVCVYMHAHVCVCVCA